MDNSIELKGKTSLWKEGNYVRLWLGQSLSLIGDYFFSATIALWIIDKLARGESWLPLAARGVPIALAVPSLFISPLAGVFVDRWDRRATMIWTELLRFILIILFLLLVWSLSSSVALLVSCFVILFLIACGQQFFAPARVAVVADLVTAEQRPQAYGSLQQATYLAQIIGPSLAAPLYIALGPSWAFLLNACSFLISFLLICTIRVPAQEKKDVQERKGFWAEFRDGLRFFVTNRVLISLLLCGMIFMFGGMAYNTFEYLYGSENLHIPEALIGVYVACYGIGVITGLPLIAILARRYSEVEVLWICLVIAGIATICLARTTSMVPAVFFVYCFGFCAASVFVTVRPLTVLVTPRTLLGRVMAFEVPLITSASLSGGLVASMLASTVLAHFHANVAGMQFGRLDTIFLVVGVLIICSGIIARVILYPAVKELRAQLALAEKAS